MRKRNYPTQGQLALPFLELLDEMGGQAKPAELYEKIGKRVGLSQKEIYEKDPNQKFYLFHRQVRWVKENLKILGYVKSPIKNVWELTEEGKKQLVNCKPNVVVHIFWTDKGDCFWGEFEAVGECIKDESVNLHITSPPYPLVAPMEYGNISAKRYIDWFMPYAEMVYRTLTPDGSMIVNLGEVYNQGVPTVNTYLERFVIALEDRLGFKLCGRFYWYNRGKLPTPLAWVGQKRIRVKRVIEPLYWFAKCDNPKADNRKVLVPYTEKHKKNLEKGQWQTRTRASGHVVGANYYNNNGGSIPGNLLDIPHLGPNDSYIRSCRVHGLKPHPARFPKSLAEWFIKFLTDKGDLIADLLCGSGTVAQAAEELGRNWLISDKSLHYLRTAVLRFNHVFQNNSLLSSFNM